MLRLKTLRKNRGYSLRELGELLGVAESTVSLYESGKREAPYAVLQKLSKIFCVSIDYLLENSEASEQNNLRIPILDSVSLEGGEINYNYSGESSYIELGDVDNYFFYMVHDGSMAPQISKGDTAVIRKQNEIESGDIAAVIYKNSSVILRRVIIQNGMIVLEAFDHSTDSVFVGSIDELTILGKVIQTIKKW